MDVEARSMAVDHLTRDSGAIPDSVEIVRARQVGDRLTVLALWTEATTGRVRRGAVDLALSEGVWRADGGWSANAGHDSDHAVWRAWGGSRRSTSGWVSDPAGATVRFRAPDGRVEADTVQNGVAILIYDSPFDGASVVEVLDDAGNLLHAAPLHSA